ncbi:MAG: cytochrome C oxidase subunit IV family protein [Candidatus Marinimicrobia bacterium]|nr:cytochrome C oxidase subunit IV family protein [Candidatus Neomarinimicrobiota bacterium]
MNEELNNKPETSTHEEPNYMKIFYWLCALTAIEILIAIIPNGPLYPNLLQGFLLISTAVWKAALVALYFMHLKYEKRILGTIAMIPLVLMIMALVFLLNDITVPEATAEDVSSSEVESVLED